MNKPSNENHGRAQKVHSTEYPTDAAVPERVPGADSSGTHTGERGDRNVARKEPRDQTGPGPTPQPPLGGERADNGSD